jgi:ABC-2 type transport system permease protein
MILWQLRVVWTVFRMHLKKIVGHSIFTLFAIVQPLLVALLAIYVLRDKEGFQAIYVIVGSGMAGLWTATLFFSTYNVNDERIDGTLEEIVASPTSLTTVVFGKTLANTLLALSSMLFSYPMAGLLFGYRLTIAHPLLFAVSLLLAILSLISLGLLLSPLVSLNAKIGDWTINVMETPVYMLGGFLFPISLLPTWTRPLSYILAPYWAARALHAASSGGVPLDDVFISWGMMIGLSLVYRLLSARLFRVLLRWAREGATLGVQ